jgi:hypothetical protein
MGAQRPRAAMTMGMMGALADVGNAGLGLDDGGLL